MKIPFLLSMLICLLRFIIAMKFVIVVYWWHTFPRKFKQQWKIKSISRKWRLSVLQSCTKYLEQSKKVQYLLSRIFWLYCKSFIPGRETDTGPCLHPNLRFSKCFLISWEPKSWNLDLIGRAEAIMLMQTIVMYIWIYVFYISFLVPTRVYFISLSDRGSQGKCRHFAISYIYKCYLTTPAS